MKLSESRPVARKRHVCSTCGAPIVLGERYVRSFNIWDGEAYTWKACEPCEALLQTVYAWVDQPYEGVTDEDYQQWAEGHLDDPDHGEAAKAWLSRKQAAHDAWVARMDAAHGKGLW